MRKHFKKANIKTIFKSTNNLKDIFCNRSKWVLSPLCTPGEYTVSWGRYVGETETTIRNIPLGRCSDSAIAKHDQNCTSSIPWVEPEIISGENQYLKRCIKGSLEIRKQKSQPGSEYDLNKDSGKYVDTNLWKIL